jgi:multidrug efflux pump subunit AcrA (membrane-fusion protein)
MRSLLLGLIVLLGIALAVVGYHLYQVYAMTGVPSPVATESLSQSPSNPGNVTADGTIVPSHHATLAFKIGGSVASVPVKQGDIVQAGVVLVKLDDADLLNQVKQADAALNVAKSQLAQLNSGGSQADRQAAQDALAAAQAKYDDAKKGGAANSALKDAAAGVSQAKSALARLDPSPQAIAVAQAQVDQAQAADDTAKTALDQAALKAPFGGTIAEINVNVGDFIGPGMPVVTFGDLSRLRVESNDISDLDIGRVRIGQAVAVTLDALPGRIFHGTVASISPVASESRGYKVFDVAVDLREGIESGLRWGMDAKIEILSGASPAAGQE